MRVNIVLYRCPAAELNQTEKQYPVEDAETLEDIPQAKSSRRIPYQYWLIYAVVLSYSEDRVHRTVSSLPSKAIHRISGVFLNLTLDDRSYSITHAQVRALLRVIIILKKLHVYRFFLHVNIESCYMGYTYVS